MACERLTDRVAVVTGAASGIGRATAVRLAAEGARVFAADVAAEPLAATVAQIGEAGGDAVAHPVDISDETAVATMAEAVVERFGRIDVLANIAGVLRTGRTHQVDLATWQRVLDINLTGTFLVTRACLPHLIRSRGAIVNAASTSSFFGHPWMAAYAASKGAIAAFTQTLAVEYAHDGVRVNAVAPGSVETAITASVTFPDDLSREESRLVRRIMAPVGMGRPEDVAAVVAMLASDDGRHLTGEIIRIDGGTHA